MSSSGPSNGMGSRSLFAILVGARLMALAANLLRVLRSQSVGLGRRFQDVYSGVIDGVVESCIAVAMIRPVKWNAMRCE